MSWRRFVFASDPHGNKQDDDANRALFKFIESWQPTVRVCGGDLWNFAALRKGADEEEKRESLLDDYGAGCEWLDKFQPTHFCRGNHDERLWDWAQLDKGVQSDLAHLWVKEIEGDMKKRRCQMLPYHKRKGILKIGHLKMAHGFYSGVNAARRTALAYGSILIGHAHSIQHATIEGLETRMGRIVGCLCQLDQDYNRAHVAALAHEHGWAYGVINDRTGDYQVWQAQRIGNKWLLPTGIEEL